MFSQIFAVAFLLQQPTQSAIARIAVTPAAPTVVAGDTLRLRAQALDAAGRPVPGANIMFQPAGGAFEARVDSAGLVSSGAVGTLPVVISAFIPGGKPVIERVNVRMVPGPAARIDVSPNVQRMLAGQRLRLEASVFSRAGD